MLRSPARAEGRTWMPTNRSAAIASKPPPNARTKARAERARVRDAPPTAPGSVAAANFHPSERSTRRWRRYATLPDRALRNTSDSEVPTASGGAKPSPRARGGTGKNAAPGREPVAHDKDRTDREAPAGPDERADRADQESEPDRGRGGEHRHDARICNTAIAAPAITPSATPPCHH